MGKDLFVFKYMLDILKSFVEKVILVQLNYLGTYKKQ